jgi:hypothetical protein
MRTSIGLTLLMCSLLAAAGCATYRAYPGPQRPRDEIALLTVVATDVHVDGEPVSPKDARRIELLPGLHTFQWSYRYPNGYSEAKSLAFEAAAGQRYRLGERFFAEPHPAGPIGAVIDVAVETALTPIKVFVPSEPPVGPPDGEYYSWIIEAKTGYTVAGLAPDVPLDHAPVTYVPAGQREP